MGAPHGALVMSGSSAPVVHSVILLEYAVRSKVLVELPIGMARLLLGVRIALIGFGIVVTGCCFGVVVAAPVVLVLGVAGESRWLFGRLACLPFAVTNHDLREGFSLSSEFRGFSEFSSAPIAF